MDLGVVGESLVAWGLVCYTSSTLEEGSLTSLSHRVNTICIQTPRAGYRSVVIDPLTTVHSPVIVTVVMHSSMSVKYETILTNLLGKSTISTLVEPIAVLFVWIQL